MQHYQFDAYGIGFQFKRNVIDNLFWSNNILLFYNGKYEKSQMLNLDANVHYVIPFWEYNGFKSPFSMYPLIGVGWANYKTESLTINHLVFDSIESAVRGSSLFYNIGGGLSGAVWNNFTINFEYKLAMGEGRKHSVFLMGMGYVF